MKKKEEKEEGEAQNVEQNELGLFNKRKGATGRLDGQRCSVIRSHSAMFRSSLLCNVSVYAQVLTFLSPLFRFLNAAVFSYALFLSVPSKPIKIHQRASLQSLRSVNSTQL